MILIGTTGTTGTGTHFFSFLVIAIPEILFTFATKYGQ